MAENHDSMISDNPFDLFSAWFQEAEANEPSDANAMTVATVSEDGVPSARILLLKGLDERGFVFYTNLESHKGRELAANPNVCLCFHWKSIRKQVRVTGRVEPVDAQEADAYFASRAKGSRIGAWASEQSRPLDKRETLEARVSELENQYRDSDVPRPAFWSGFRVTPSTIEFWRDGAFRLHDRIVYTRSDTGWSTQRLYP